ncbi:Zinc finger protein on ecdysone puffs [Danaus plexippus plexippus]|uniref:Zinc finger protein on ecdysone puffs n=1 Tax=Danaus plexippus plexippus TaxID=278856 RepID=A0A212FIZ8_DANPL|nr:Zinc finger protein on ecdysone puffs [Danaus plexippus plexippus]
MEVGVTTAAVEVVIEDHFVVTGVAADMMAAVGAEEAATQPITKIDTTVTMPTDIHQVGIVESSASYSNRDYGGRSGSPERKRMRMEHRSDANRIIYRAHRAIDVATMAAVTMAARTAVDRRVTASGGRSRARTGGGRRLESIASPVAWGRRESRSERSSGRGLRDAHSADEHCALAPSIGEPPVPVDPSPLGDLLKDRWGTPAHLELLRGEGNAKCKIMFKLVSDPMEGEPDSQSSVKSKEDEASSTEEDWEADEKEEVIEEKKETKNKSPEVSAPEVEGSEGEAGEGGEDTDKEPDAASDTAPSRPYVHLACVHCKEKCVTFGSYTKHLLSSKHRAAMSSVARRHKLELLRMRVAQRGAQRDLEAAAGAELAARTTFCLVCRLNHRTTRHAHNLTDTHRAMKRLLMPFCRICRITFRSPMIYEHHICSVEHLKKKASLNARRASPKAEASADEGMDVDLDNFMTLDSVGDVDEVEDDDSGGEKKDESAPKKTKVEINIGSEHIKKLEVHWCELCRVYLPRVEAGSAEEAEALRRHCRLRVHLGRYVQHRDTRTLRRHAERIHRQLHQQKEDEKEVAASEEVADKEKIEKKEPSVENANLENGADLSNISGSEDKLWADVDKDIGELLREVDPQGNEASDDDEDLGRYDKFRKSDKKPKADLEEGEDAKEEISNEKANVEVKTSI